MTNSPQSLLNSVKTLLEQHAIVAGKGLMLCGLSGGADSVALVLILQRLGFAVRALHCNFHLRGDESERDERFVRDLCQRRQIPLEVIGFDTEYEAQTHGESIEMAARRLRYRWFAAVAQRLRAEQPLPPHVCVAHHADDNVETLLLHLIRGAGLHGLTGMRVVNDSGVVRPLLETPRAALLEFLENEGESFVVDSSNADVRYRRNRIRHELLPLLRSMNPNISAVLRRTMRHLADAERQLALSDSGTDALRRRLLAIGFNPTQISQVEGGRNGAYTVANGYVLTRSHGALCCAPMPQALEPTPLAVGDNPVRGKVFRLQRGPWPVAGLDLRQPCRAVIDVRAVEGALSLRSVAQGDRFTPYGMRGTRLVSDYLTDRHRTRIDKLAALVLTDARGILWLVGETIDARAAVTADTAEVFILSTQ